MPNSVNQFIKNKLIEMLEEENESLVVGGRQALVVEYLGEDTFSQARTPMIAIPRVEKNSEDRLNLDDDRREFNATLLIVDAASIQAQGAEDAAERLDTLGDLMRGVFGLEKNRNLQMADLDVFYSMCSWTEGEPLSVGNNLLLKGHILSIPVTVPRGRMLEIQEGD